MTADSFSSIDVFVEPLKHQFSAILQTAENNIKHAVRLARNMSAIDPPL